MGQRECLEAGKERPEDGGLGRLDASRGQHPLAIHYTFKECMLVKYTGKQQCQSDQVLS